MAGKLSLLFSHQFEYPIWKYLISFSYNELGLELRDMESEDILYGYIQLGEEEPILFHMSECIWWSNFYAFDQATFYVKIYESENNPTVGKYLSFNASGKVLSKEEFHHSDMGSDNEIQFPSLFHSDNEYYTTLASFISQWQTKGINLAGIEYFENEKAVFLSYYTGNEKLENYLLVVDFENNILLHDRIGSNLEGIGQDTFRVVANKLIFVKDRCTLFIYQFL